MLLTAEPPRYLGGAPPTPLAVPGPVDQNPSLQSCTTETLRRSSRCVFDARPLAADGDEARKKQAKNNLELAANLGKAMCNARLEQANAEPKEKSRRMSLCLDGALRASGECSLSGGEALLDAEGRFSPNARSCYEALATALQSADIPPEPKPKPGDSRRAEPSPIPAKI